MRYDIMYLMNYIYEYDSPVGRLTVSSDGESLTGLWIAGQKYFAATLNGQRTIKKLPVFEQVKEWLADYFERRIPPFTPPLAPSGSAFRRSVWDILLTVPYGEVITYRDIAKKIAAQTGRATMSAQAVGGAVGHNPISIVIPCHRVVGSDGSLTGYAGGLDVKQKLLALEGADMIQVISNSE